MPLEKVYKYLIVSLGCMFISPLVIHAECSYERQAELSRIASNVQFSYSYEMKSNQPQFSVNITNLTNDIYIVDNYNNIFSGNGEKREQYSYGKTINFNIYSNDPLCYGEELMVQYVNIPHFNRYSEDEVCKNKEEYKLCQMWVNTSHLSIDQFRKEVNKYKKNEPKNNQIDTEETWWTAVYKIIVQNYYIFIILLVLIIAIAIKKKTR